MNEDNYEFNGLCKEVFLMIISPDLNVLSEQALCIILQICPAKYFRWHLKLLTNYNYNFSLITLNSRNNYNKTIFRFQANKNESPNYSKFLIRRQLSAIKVCRK